MEKVFLSRTRARGRCCLPHRLLPAPGSLHVLLLVPILVSTTIVSYSSRTTSTALMITTNQMIPPVVTIITSVTIAPVIIITIAPGVTVAISTIPCMWKKERSSPSFLSSAPLKGWFYIT